MGNNEQQNITASRQALVKLISHWTENEYRLETKIPGLLLVRYEAPTEPKSAMYEPCICLVAQGAKRVQLGNEEYVYDENHMLITSVGLPVMASVIQASKEAPLFSLVLKLDLHVVSQLMLDSNLPEPRTQQPDRAMAVCEVSSSLIDSFIRLVNLLDTPEDIPILSPLILKEILYRLLMGDLGPRLRQIATAGSHGHQIAKAVNWLKGNYSKQLKVEGLARETGMSLSTFHHHFRALTAMSPLQFQKWLRLHEARRLMLTESQDATTAALQVGYESASQFSREYKRQFGAPPLRDIKTLHQSGQQEVITGMA
ncbi:AraC family transcriptional regulator [Desulfovibrio desulfuricans]|uniref:AraC family transcriptional regulator n=1 Tax=Desulfovibrio desulfuricans TaxID=876 RepID=UPI001AE75802|nr:AraC family transcriptional regulator [Desulfovibrio desulfuricans]MDD3683578.1 AraC family transcriptional regulator [Desulfovibrio desulfuricans]QTO39924.1 AraC family transcriptional regulator [Desulfovibrio desulfuricans]